MNLKKIILTGVFLAVTIFPAFAQRPQSMQAGANFTIGVPQNDFRENIDNNAFGGTGFFFYNFPYSPVHIGASLGYMVYGSESYERRLIPDADVNVDINTTNSILQGHLIFRVQPSQSTVRPYMDGLLGFNYFSTSTSIEDKNKWGDDAEIASENNFDDGAFSYGGGAGVQFQVYRPSDEQIALNNIYGVVIDVGVRYLKGGEAEYLDEGGITQDPDTKKFDYDIKKSATDLLTWHIGFAILF